MKSYLLRSFCALAWLAITAGCHLDFIRSRGGTPINLAEYQRLEPKKTTREEAVGKLGAPEKIEWKNGKDYLWYLYKDSLDTGIRFQFPPFRTGLGYQHTFLRLDEEAEDTNAMALVFDEAGLLERKSLRISDAYQPPPEDASTWKLHLTAHGDYSVLLQGDGGIRDYGNIFENGYRAGVSAGFQPVPVATLLLRGSYQEHQGKSFRRSAVKISFDDLELFEIEIGLRLAAPLNLFWTFTDYNSIRKVLFEEDLSRAVGFRFYLEGTTGVTFNSRVPVKLNAIPGGNFYDRGWGLSGTVEAGLEYGWKWGEVHIGATYQTIEAFNKGNSRLDDDGGGLQALLLGGGLSVKL